MVRNGKPERRTHRRLVPSGRLDSQTLSGYFRVADIGEGGLRMYSDEEVDVERPIDFEIDLNGGETLHCTGRVIWQKALDEEAPARYDLGVEFVNLSGKNKAALEAFLASH